MRRALAVLCLLLVACGYQDVPAAFDWDSPEPLTALPPCDPPPPPSGDPAPPGVVLPPGAVVTDVTVQEPLTTVSGYVQLTPIGIRLDYQERDGGDVDIILIEDEVFEVELLASTGAHRMFLKGLAACDQGTRLQIVVAPEIDAEGLPVPEGRPHPGGRTP